MAGSDSSDLLIAVKPKGMRALMGDARSQVDTSDSLMTGFTVQGATSLFGEANSFTFGAGLEDEGDPQDKAMAELMKSLGSQPGGTDGKPPKGMKLKPKKRKFDRFFKGETSGPNGTPFDVTLEEVTITRELDRMSIKLLELCVKQQEIETITLVRRKSVGGSLAHKMQPFLRVQFSGVLLTAVDWDEDEEVIEKVKFVYRSFTSAFKPQQPDGSLATQAMPASVSYSDADSG
jgi:type VI protein secretion system component Hcp